MYASGIQYRYIGRTAVGGSANVAGVSIGAVGMSDPGAAVAVAGAPPAGRRLSESAITAVVASATLRRSVGRGERDMAVLSTLKGFRRTVAVIH